MNKKLQKGLTTTMAVAMGVGIAVPTVSAIAAPATTTAGWVKVGTTWNYLKNGTKATGWVKDGATWYFLNASGTMQTGWVKDGATWYFLNASGAMKTGWVKDGASWYFLNASGAMQTGWVKDAGTWYYLFNSGSMAVNTTVDGWKLDGSGAGSLASVVPPVVPPVVTPATVSSVSAINATSFAVKFSAAPADASKVAFTVTREGTPVTLTTSWDSTGTVATLTDSSNLPVDTYAVDVKNGTTDLGTTNVTVVTQQIAKIQVTSTALGVTPPGSGNVNAGYGYATYKVLDQYGNDITTSALANEITWSCGIGTISASNGILTVEPLTGGNTYLTQYQVATITGIDQTTGTTVTANLTVSQNQGTLSDVSLTTLTSPSNAVLTAGDTTDTFYINYTALDLSGNSTNNFNLIQAGLMLQAGNQLVTSNPNVTATLVRDPNNTNNALIQVQPQASSSGNLTDQPLVITAFTTSGKSSTINLTLKKAAQLNTFTLMAPSQSIAAGDTNVIIPFTAVDQNGVVLTKYTDIAGKVSISANGLNLGGVNGTGIQENPDGTASIVIASVPTIATSTQQFTMQAVVTGTGQFNTLNLVVQKAATPNGVTVSNTVALPNMESGAVQNVDFGADFGGLAVQDQYGRSMDMTNQTITGTSGSYYYVYATATGSTVKVVNPYAYADQNIQLLGTATPGTSTVTYTVYQHTWNSAGDATKVSTTAAINSSFDTVVPGVSPVAEQYTVVKPTDITGYTMGKISAPLYDVASTGITSDFAMTTGGTVSADCNTVGTAITTTGSGITYKTIWNGDNDDYEGYADVYGTLAGGAKVALANVDIVSASVDNPSDFVADYTRNANTPNAAACVGVLAKNTLNSSKTTASGNLIVTINGSDGLIHTVSTPISSIDALPGAKSIAISIAQINGSTYDQTNNAVTNQYSTGNYNGITVSGNNVTVPFAVFNSKIMGKTFVRGTSGDIYIYGVDQYGTYDAPMSSIQITNVKSSVSNNYTYNSTTGLTCSGNPTTGDSFTVTGITSTGLVQSLNITVGN